MIKIKLKNKTLKKFILFPIYLIEFIISFLSLIRFLKKNINKIYFIQLEGGFGHTITTPYMLDFHYDKDWILIFGFSKHRHNKEINKLFNNKIFFIDITFAFFLDFKHKIKLENFLKSLIFRILKIKINSIHGNNEKITAAPYNKNKEYLKRLDSKFFWIYHKTNKIYKLPSDLNEKFTAKIKKFNPNKNKIVNFIIRTKDTDKNFALKKTGMSRDFGDINKYEKVIEFLVNKNFKILFSGDEFVFPESLIKFKENFITLEDTNFKKEEYGIFAGMCSNFSIGPVSGALHYNLLTRNPSLILDCGVFGYGYPNSLISYKKIQVNSALDLKKIFLDFFYNFSDPEYIRNFYKNNKTEELNEDELLLILKEFIEIIENKKVSVKPKDLEINEGIMMDTDVNISSVWLDLINIRVK